MRALLAFVCFLSVQAVAQQRPVEIDPNTRIQGGADVRGSGAKAGAEPRTDPNLGVRPHDSDAVANPQKVDPKEDKPISARKPPDLDREREQDAARGETAKRQ